MRDAPECRRPKYESTLDRCDTRASIPPGMRKSNRGIVLTGLVLAAAMTAACGATPGASGALVPTPTPLVTPDPHLADPASVDVVIRTLNQWGMRITPNTASAGAGGEPVKRVNATYSDWPLVITQFSSAAALRETTGFDPAKPPRLEESPYIIVGLNILVEFGPHSDNDRTPAPPSPAKREAAITLIGALHPLLGPLAQRSTEALPLPGVPTRPTPEPTPAPSASAAP